MDATTDDSPENSAGRDAASGRELREDPLVEALAPDPAAVERTVMLSGHLGRSTSDGRWRLYLNDSLTEFVEIDEQDILHSEQPAFADVPGVRTRLWVSASIELEYRRVESTRVQADFLRGEFVNELVPSPANMMAMVGTGVVATIEPCIIIINRTFTTCTNTLFGACRSFGGICDPRPPPQSHSPSGCLSLNACP